MPTTLDHVARIAARAPSRTAAVANGRIVTYATLEAELRGEADRLRRLGLASHRTVAVGCAELWRQLLIATAFEALGIAVASFRPDEGAECAALLDGADAAVCDADAPPGLRRLLAERLREARLDDLSVWSKPETPLPEARRRPADAPVAIIRSSGTTGRSKRMVVTRTMFEARCANRVEAYGLSSDTCCFAAMHLSVSTVHVGLAATWRLGGAAMMEDRMPLADALAIYRPTHLSLLPRQTEALLAELPANFERIDRLTLISLGARLPPSLRDAALARLAGSVVDHYGTNEAGLICTLGPDGAGALVPGLSACIVDDAGNPVAEGSPGRLRVAGPAIVSGYLDDPGATADGFFEGWSEPGDEAALLGGGRLRPLGRADDVLNLGGLKSHCADLEAVVRIVPGVADAAAAEIAGKLTLAVAVTQGADPCTVLAAVRMGFEPDARVLQIATVPRTPLGKIKRRELRELLASDG